MQSRQHRLALLGAWNRRIANNRYPLADVHQDIRVIDRNAVAIDRIERNDVVVHTLAEVREHIEVRPR